MHAIASAIYRLALALWVGGMSVFSFVVTPVIFRTQTRGDAGKIVRAIFPVYFRFCLVVVAISLVARAVAGTAFAGMRQLAGTALIIMSLALVSYHTFGLAPRMETIRETVVSLEKTPEEDPARQEFSRLHGLSITLNLVVIACGAVLILWYEAFRS